MAFVMLGMSGGVDSTVSAALLKDMGHRVEGVFFIMHETHLSQLPEAEKAAADAGVKLNVTDIRDKFREKVTDNFVAEYLSGRTPNPCVDCNRNIKFPYLLKAAEEAGAEYIATGHYASVILHDGLFYISRGADRLKDQSYFLYPLGQEILSRLMLPLSELTKTQIREYASGHGFAVASKHDSQDICFIEDGDSGAFVKNNSDLCPAPGAFTGTDGRVFGRHKGIFNYTVGQRRGLGIAYTESLYVQSIVPAENRIILCTEKELYKNTVSVEGCVFAGGISEGEFEADVCLRYSKKCAKALIKTDGNRALLQFGEPQRAPAPGQSAVFYDGDRVIGGGIISGSR